MADTETENNYAVRVYTKSGKSYWADIGSKGLTAQETIEKTAKAICDHTWIQVYGHADDLGVIRSADITHFFIDGDGHELPNEGE